VLATDVLLEVAGGENPDAVPEQLVQERILPVCYRRQYDSRFLTIFHNVLEIARNALVSDIPFASTTAAQFAVCAILAQTKRIVCGPLPWQAKAAAIDPDLPDAIPALKDELCAILDRIEAQALEDTDFLFLFDVPEGQAPDEHLVLRQRLGDFSLLHFENWLIPFGNPPRPRIAADGRAWPA
jgi:hypothetical protein